MAESALAADRRDLARAVFAAADQSRSTVTTFDNSATACSVRHRPRAVRARRTSGSVR